MKQTSKSPRRNGGGVSIRGESLKDLTNTIILSDRRRSPLRRRSGFEMESVFLKMRGERPLSRVSTGKLSLSRRSQLLTAPTEPAAAVQQLHDPEESIWLPLAVLLVLHGVKAHLNSADLKIS
ncbi:hypothetical protein FQA47_007903 [Oryzias melastigma]|uniref:Uncharacterized protein n=1 Tax=Oryzias melastigma TaxID=30732 RepID=A0A834CAA1_ORYME|nr:hypothetical protein FQA47_007903 [Oryzias melastigma]